ncbi:MAG: hypothetical protein L6U99_00880 [Clostridium sp.]|nr:MAG: hypothetical protein L6U99_00880 [Clostridium sp.]
MTNSNTTIEIEGEVDGVYSVLYSGKPNTPSIILKKLMVILFLVTIIQFLMNLILMLVEHQLLLSQFLVNHLVVIVYLRNLLF